MPIRNTPPEAPAQEAAEGGTPFVILLQERDRTPSGYFRPEASVTIRPALRTSGLLLALPPDEVKTLLLMLTFVTNNGWCRPVVPQIAEAMRVGEAKARARMRRLQEFAWQGQPLVAEVPHDSGLTSFVLSQKIALMEQAAPESLPAQVPLPRPAGREAVVAYSRARYAKTRAEVEAQIGELMGWGPPAFTGEDPAVADGKRQAYQRMTDLGVLKEQALDLLARFDLALIERQLDWLPHRRAKSPARFLVAAIENDYEAPPVVRLQQARADEAQSPESPTAGGPFVEDEGNAGQNAAMTQAISPDSLTSHAEQGQ